MAISNITAPGKYTSSDGHEGHSLKKNDAALGETTVTVTTIDEALRNLKIKKLLDMLKVDVEGVEIAALKGTAKRSQKIPRSG